MCNFLRTIFLTRKLTFVDFPCDHDSIDLSALHVMLLLSQSHAVTYIRVFYVVFRYDCDSNALIHTEFIGLTKREHIQSAYTSIVNTRIQYSRLNGVAMHHAAVIVTSRRLLLLKNHRNTYIYMESTSALKRSTLCPQKRQRQKGKTK